jgi:hypothetical protein
MGIANSGCNEIRRNGKDHEEEVITPNFNISSLNLHLHFHGVLGFWGFGVGAGGKDGPLGG